MTNKSFNMTINKESVIEHFKFIQDLKERESEIKANIKNDESLPSYEKTEKILNVSVDTDFQIDLKQKDLFKVFEELNDNEGYIKHLAEININVYTKKEHKLLKDLLKSKGFESNEFNAKENKFSALIGSDSINGLNKIISEIDVLCGENNIFFELNQKAYTDGTNNVEIGSGSKLLAVALTRIDSPIVIGSKVNEVINFNVTDYNFTMFMKSNGYKFIGFNKTEEEIIPEKKNILKDFINKLINKENSSDISDEQTLSLGTHISNIKEKFIENQKKVEIITGINTPFEPEFHSVMDSKVGLLRSYQLELKRSERLLTSIIEHQLGKNEVNEVEIKQVINRNSNFLLK